MKTAAAALTRAQVVVVYLQHEDENKGTGGRMGIRRLLAQKRTPSLRQLLSACIDAHAKGRCSLGVVSTAKQIAKKGGWVMRALTHAELGRLYTIYHDCTGGTVASLSRGWKNTISPREKKGHREMLARGVCVLHPLIVIGSRRKFIYDGRHRAFALYQRGDGATCCWRKP